MGSTRLVRARVGLAVLLGLGMAMLVIPVAQAYPSTVCSVLVTPKHLVGGKPITVKGTANEAIDWTFVLKAAHPTPGVKTQVARGHGRTFTHVFHTPKVAKSVPLVLTSSCGGSSGAVIDAVGGNNNHGGPASHGSGGGGVLPNTGGPSWWLALLALVLLGGGAVTVRRQIRNDRS